MYTITRTLTAEAGTPEILPQAGDVLVCKRTFITLAGNVYDPGDTFELLFRTQDAPRGYLSSLGNWKVRCKYFISVWSCIEDAMHKGWLARQ